MPRFFPQSRSFISEMEFRIKVLLYLLIANLEHLLQFLQVQFLQAQFY